MSELVVIAAHGPDYVRDCVESWRPSHVRLLVIDTGSGLVPPLSEDSVEVGRNYATGAYLWAYENTDADAFLFTQDSCTVTVPDPLAWFRDRMSDELGAVAWQLFPWSFGYANDYQREWTEAQYAHPHITPEYGILSPIFYTTRVTLDRLRDRKLLPKVPTNRDEACGTERAWAYAFERAGVPLVGEPFSPTRVPEFVTDVPPLRKTWGGRP